MKKQNRETIHFIQESIQGKRHYIVFLSLLQVLLGLTTVGIAYLLRYVIQGLNTKNGDLFYPSLIVLTCFALATVAFHLIYRFLYEYAYSELENAYKKRLYDDILSSPYEEIKNKHEEDWINRFSNDCSVVTTNILSIFPSLSRMVVQLVSALVLIIISYPLFGLLLIPITFVLILFTYLMRKRLKKLHVMFQEEDGRLKIFYSESLQGLSIIHSFVKQDLFKKKDVEQLQEHKKARVKRNNFSNLCSLGYIVVYYLAFVLVIFLCGRAILDGRLEASILTSMIFLLSQVESPLAHITSIIPRYYALLASAERIHLLPKQRKEAISKEEIHSYYENSFKEISLENLSFTYMDSHGREVKALSSFSLEIHKGEKIALVGPSGKGKSTLMKLLLGLYHPQEGTLSLLDEEGKRELDERYHHLFSYVPQDNLLLQGSIEEVVTLFDEHVSEERLKKALELSCSLSFVQELKDGVKTKLKEKGSGLSLGQMQRLAIARALYSDAPILLLDECTSALDEKNEKEVLDGLFSLKDKTILMISHHKDNLTYCDKIMEL